MINIESKYRDLAKVLNLELSACDRQYFFHGTRDGYEIVVYTINPKSPYMFTAAVAAASPSGSTIEPQQLKEFAKAHASVVSFKQKENRFILEVNMRNYGWAAEHMGDCLNELVSFLADKGYMPCCQCCGQRKETAAYLVVREPLYACQDCMEKILHDKETLLLQNQQKKEYVATGIIGALLGSVLGVICILLFGQMGRISVVSGAVMGICTVKGYELLAGKATKKGIVFSVILILVMTYIGDRLEWAFEVKKVWGIGLKDAFIIVPELLAEGVIETMAYWGNLVMLYIFTLGGAIPTINMTVIDKEVKVRVLRIDSGEEVSFVQE